MGMGVSDEAGEQLGSILVGASLYEANVGMIGVRNVA
jgi:hypothetical protein